MDSSVDAVIIGMGYVGLPLAREAVAAGLRVIGFDVNPEVVDGLNHGRSHIDDLSIPTSRRCSAEASSPRSTYGSCAAPGPSSSVFRRPCRETELPDLGPVRVCRAFGCRASPDRARW